MQTALIVHGHFYQPPRENPWTEALDREASATPFHDWNERIYHECYRANAYCRVLDGFGRIERIVNNYARLSYNIGPTLLRWLERQHPATYQRILEADHESRRNNNGHGNAIAQAYNHTILPLATARDRQTQIRWGLADFRHRFGREAEALWLPETACNDDTLEALIDAGLRFVILSPHQAEKVRPIGAKDWKDVSAGSIDTSVPYRWSHRDGSGRSIAVFFYAGALAQAIAFEGALASSQGLLEHLRRAVRGRLVHVATDGETYGHHTPAGDRTLAYALAEEAPRRGFEVTNYGAFLDRTPPAHEVQLKAGEQGLGTAWSCAHGLSRWYRDCGCSTGGREGWNQAWRTPLRAALDRLRARADQLFEEQASELLRDPWAARDDYMSLLLHAHAGPGDFLARHAKEPLGDAKTCRALTLLEMQRSTQLMYTSCGWFFADISGLETVQVLKYAGRTLDLLSELDGRSERAELLERLAEAKSNLPEMGNGADVFRRSVDPYRVTGHVVAAHVALSGLVEERLEPAGEAGGHRYSAQEIQRSSHGTLTLLTARIEVESVTTSRRVDCAVAALHLGGADFYCALRPYGGEEAFRLATQRLASAFWTVSLPVLLRTAQEVFGPEEYGLEGILPDERERISEMIFAELVKRFTEQYSVLFTDHRRTLDMLQSAGFRLPPELRAAAEFTLGRRFEEEILEQHHSTDPAAYRKAIEIAEEVALRGYQINRSVAARIFTALITETVWKALTQETGADLESAMALLELTERLHIAADLTKAQEALYEHRRALSLSDPRRRLAGPLRLAPAIFGETL